MMVVARYDAEDGDVTVALMKILHEGVGLANSY